MIAIVVMVASVTVTVAEPDTPLRVAVIEVLPTPVPVTSPSVGEKRYCRVARSPTRLTGAIPGRVVAKVASCAQLLLGALGE